MRCAYTPPRTLPSTAARLPVVLDPRETRASASIALLSESCTTAAPFTHPDDPWARWCGVPLEIALLVCEFHAQGLRVCHASRRSAWTQRVAAVSTGIRALEHISRPLERACAAPGAGLWSVAAILDAVGSAPPVRRRVGIVAAEACARTLLRALDRLPGQPMAATWAAASGEATCAIDTLLDMHVTQLAHLSLETQRAWLSAEDPGPLALLERWLEERPECFAVDSFAAAARATLAVQRPRTVRIVCGHLARHAGPREMTLLLWKAITADSASVVRQLLRHGPADPTDDHGSLILAACSRGLTHSLEALLEDDRVRRWLRESEDAVSLCLTAATRRHTAVLRLLQPHTHAPRSRVLVAACIARHVDA